MRYLIGVMGMVLFAGSALAQESPQLREQFDTLDRNKDGVITQQELDLAEQDRVRELELDTPAQFDEADLNKDGALDSSEFSAFETVFPEGEED